MLININTQNISITSKCFLTLLPSPSSQSMKQPMISFLLSMVTFAYSRFSYVWNYAVYAFLCETSSTQHTIVETHACCCLRPQLGALGIFYYVAISLVYPFPCWWLPRWFLVGAVMKICYKLHCTRLFCECTFSFLLNKYLRVELLSPRVDVCLIS